MSFVISRDEPIPYKTGLPDPDTYGIKRKAQQLTKALKAAEGPVVIAVDGPWGSGKSFFLKSWSGEHGLEAEVIYFDAFQHDFLDEPLVSLLQANERKEDSTATDKLINGAKKVLPFVAKAGLRMATWGAVQELDELGDMLTGEVHEAANAALDAYWKVESGRHVAMEKFRRCLGAFLNDPATPNQLVIIVDELDRCRPDYALQTLEVIKHFFAEPGVQFVLGANIEQLKHSVRARYGVGIAADKYLQRFIHATMDMRNGTQRFTTNKLEIEYFNNLDAEGWYSHVSDRLGDIPRSEPITFRDMDRLYTLCKVSTNPSMPDLMDLWIGLVIIKACRPQWLEDIQSGQMPAENVATFLGLSPSKMTEKSAVQDYAKRYVAVWRASLGLLHSGELPRTAQAYHDDHRQIVKYPLLVRIINNDLSGFELS